MLRATGHARMVRRACARGSKFGQVASQLASEICRLAGLTNPLLNQYISARARLDNWDGRLAHTGRAQREPQSYAGLTNKPQANSPYKLQNTRKLSIFTFPHWPAI